MSQQGPARASVVLHPGFFFAPQPSILRTSTTCLEHCRPATPRILHRKPQVLWGNAREPLAAADLNFTGKRPLQ
jgi:hypothetical protein